MNNQQVQFNFEEPPRMKSLIAAVRGTDQDFEWYPTTGVIIDKIARDMKVEFYRKQVSFLDCGAGNGSVITALKPAPGDENLDGKIGKGYAIEKSRPLLDAMDKSIFIVGTDFLMQTLIDKQVDVVFSNPHYSQFKVWATKIIREANSKIIYLVMPQRWKECADIQNAIEVRKGKASVLMSYDFENSEFRKARAKVDLVKISLATGRWSESCDTDPFGIWFRESFEPTADKVGRAPESSKAESRRARIKMSVVPGVSLVDRMERLYQDEMSDLIEMYRNLSQLDPEIMRELDVQLAVVIGGMSSRIKGLKNSYWQELFDRLDSITSRLTTKSRQTLLNTLQSNTSVDFSADNATAVVLWTIKQANNYFDSQLIDTFETLFNPDSAITYKSNDRVFSKEDWRWNRNNDPDYFNRYTLDYRIVHDQSGGIDCYEYSYDKVNGLSKRAAEFLNDLATIANNLGYACADRAVDFEWFSGKKNDFITTEGEGKSRILMSVRAYQNGNIHIKFDQKFMKAFNIEFGRLKGWLRSKEQAAYETGYSEKDIGKMMKSNFSLSADTFPLLEKFDG